MMPAQGAVSHGGVKLAFLFEAGRKGSCFWWVTQKERKKGVFKSLIVVEMCHFVCYEKSIRMLRTNKGTSFLSLSILFFSFECGV